MLPISSGSTSNQTAPVFAAAIGTPAAIASRLSAASQQNDTSTPLAMATAGTQQSNSASTGTEIAVAASRAPRLTKVEADAPNEVRKRWRADLRKQIEDQLPAILGQTVMDIYSRKKYRPRVPSEVCKIRGALMGNQEEITRIAWQQLQAAISLENTLPETRKEIQDFIRAMVDTPTGGRFGCGLDLLWVGVTESDVPHSCRRFAGNAFQLVMGRRGLLSDKIGEFSTHPGGTWQRWQVEPATSASCQAQALAALNRSIDKEVPKILATVMKELFPWNLDNRAISNHVYKRKFREFVAAFKQLQVCFEGLAWQRLEQELRLQHAPKNFATDQKKFIADIVANIALSMDTSHDAWDYRGIAGTHDYLIACALGLTRLASVISARATQMSEQWLIPPVPNDLHADGVYQVYGQIIRDFVQAVGNDPAVKWLLIDCEGIQRAKYDWCRSDDGGSELELLYDKTTFVLKKKLVEILTQQTLVAKVAELRHISFERHFHASQMTKKGAAFYVRLASKDVERAVDHLIGSLV